MSYLKKYYDQLAEQYISHIQMLIKDQTDKKEAVSMQLSDEERKLQEDNDWLVEFSNRLERIERD